MTNLESTSNNSTKRFRVVQRIWENGRLIDEQTVLPSATFEQAATLSRRLTRDRVRTNNQDITVSVVAL